MTSYRIGDWWSFRDGKVLIHTRDLNEHGMARAFLRWDRYVGAVVRLAPGLYRSSREPLSFEHVVQAAQLIYPRGVICLYTALHLEGVVLRPQSEVWIAIDRRARRK